MKFNQSIRKSWGMKGYSHSSSSDYKSIFRFNSPPTIWQWCIECGKFWIFLIYFQSFRCKIPRVLERMMLCKLYRREDSGWKTHFELNQRNWKLLVVRGVCQLVTIHGGNASSAWNFSKQIWKQLEYFNKILVNPRNSHKIWCFRFLFLFYQIIITQLTIKSRRYKPCIIYYVNRKIPNASEP